MARAGTSGASAVLQAGTDLSRMLAAAQLGITICSLLLGRLGEPAVAHLIERPFSWLGLPDEVLGPVAFTISLVVVVVAHMVLGEMVPKNIAIAGPERTAIMAGAAVPGVHHRDEPGHQPVQDHGSRCAAAHGSAAARRAGYGDHLRPARRPDRRIRPRGPPRRPRLAAAHPHAVLGGPHRRRRAGDARRARCRCRSGRSSTTSRAPWPTPGSPGSRCAPARASPATCTSRTSSTSPTTPPPRCRPSGSGGCRRCGSPTGSTSRSPCCAGRGAHLGRAVDAGGATAGLVTLEDLIEHYVGTVRDATHAREERA